jgi:hypothetical protein
MYWEDGLVIQGELRGLQIWTVYRYLELVLVELCWIDMIRGQHLILLIHRLR